MPSVSLGSCAGTRFPSALTSRRGKTRSSSLSVPRSISCMTAAPVNGLETLAIRNSDRGRTGSRVSESANPNPRAAPRLPAGLRPVENLVRQAREVRTGEVETTLAVRERAYAELEGEAAPDAVMSPASVALKNAIGKLKALRLELNAK